VDDRDDGFVGIWTDPDGEYTLGLIKSTADPRYAYLAMVLESERAGWEPGEIKAKFSSLNVGEVSVGRWKMSNHLEEGVTWRTRRNAIVALNSPGSEPLALIKVYPREKGSGKGDSSGTAWAISSKGLFITNYHVIKNAKTIHIGFNKGKNYPAQVVLADPSTDLALLRVRGSTPDCGPIPALSSAKTGQSITVIGFPLTATLGEEPRVVTGVINALQGVQSDASRAQISAPLQPGNSGGPVFNEKGAVVGVAVAKLRDIASPDRDVENVNFMVKASYIRALVEQAGIRPKHMPKNAKDQNAEAVFERYGQIVQPVSVSR